MHREPAERLGEYIVYLLQDLVHLEGVEAAKKAGMYNSTAAILVSAVASLS